MFCTKCGARLMEDDRFCSQCGAAVHARKPARAPQHSAVNVRDGSGAARGLAIGFAIGLVALIAFGAWIWRDYQRGEPQDSPQVAVSTASGGADTSQAQTEAPTEAANLGSGGLGLTDDEWRSVHGDPVDTQFGDALNRYPGDGDHHADIRPLMNDTGQMTYIEVNFDSPIPVGEAEAIVASYLPDDAKLVDQYNDDLVDQPVYLYHSKWLAEVGPPSESSWWFGAEPGSFAVIYGWPSNDRPTGPVASAMITLGHSP